MRLGQLSRKIGIQPSRISTFLESKNYLLEAGSNSKLTKEQEQLIKAHFDYIEKAAEEVAETIVEAVTNTEPEKEVIEEVIEDALSVPVEQEKVIIETKEDNITEIVPTTEEANDEVIRAPKLKLEGLKVIGKIDLPEPKVKEETAKTADADESIETEATIKEVGKKPIRKKINRNKYNRRPLKRVLTLEEKQQRQSREKQRQKKEQKEKEKQFKAAYYESKMRERKPISTKKKKRKASNLEELRPEINTPVPKTLIGKFFKWLNT